jgi:alpha-tubulin suppressor-like RCC1 family protein
MNINRRFRGGSFFALALAVVAWVSGAARAEVDVVSWGLQTYDQGDLRERYSQIAAGASHTVALKNDGSVVAWGDNSYGQCTVPAGLAGVTQVAAGGVHTVALKNDGSVVAWGWNGYGQCTVPAGLAGVTQIAAGWEHTVALKNDGSVVAWAGTATANAPCLPVSQA